LGAPGKVDVGVVCINVAASLATIDAIFALSRFKAAAAKFGIDSKS
jgi:hypothetical protein